MRVLAFLLLLCGAAFAAGELPTGPSGACDAYPKHTRSTKFDGKSYEYMLKHHYHAYCSGGNLECGGYSINTHGHGWGGITSAAGSFVRGLFSKDYSSKREIGGLLDNLVRDQFKVTVKSSEHGRGKLNIFFGGCCRIHDIEGYCGGSREEFHASNERLFECMLGNFDKVMEHYKVTPTSLGRKKFTLMAQAFRKGLNMNAVAYKDRWPSLESDATEKQRVKFEVRSQSCQCGGNMPTPICDEQASFDAFPEGDPENLFASQKSEAWREALSEGKTNTCGLLLGGRVNYCLNAEGTYNPTCSAYDRESPPLERMFNDPTEPYENRKESWTLEPGTPFPPACDCFGYSAADRNEGSMTKKLVFPEIAALPAARRAPVGARDAAAGCEGHDSKLGRTGSRVRLFRRDDKRVAFNWQCNRAINDRIVKCPLRCPENGHWKACGCKPCTLAFYLEQAEKAFSGVQQTVEEK